MLSFQTSQFIFLSSKPPDSMPCENFSFRIFEFYKQIKNNFHFFSRTEIFYDAVQKNRDQAKHGATSSKMLTHVLYRVVTLASLAEYIYWPISSFESQIKKCQEEAKEEKDSERVVPRDTEKFFVIISKVLPSQQFDDWWSQRNLLINLVVSSSYFLKILSKIQSPTLKTPREKMSLLLTLSMH